MLTFKCILEEELKLENLEDFLPETNAYESITTKVRKIKKPIINRIPKERNMRRQKFMPEIDKGITKENKSDPKNVRNKIALSEEDDLITSKKRKQNSLQLNKAL